MNPLSSEFAKYREAYAAVLVLKEELGSLIAKLNNRQPSEVLTELDEKIKLKFKELYFPE